MQIVVRTDASLEIGTGHVMRCLTLAASLSDQGAEVRFLCRAHNGNLIDLINCHGSSAEILPVDEGAGQALDFTSGPAHAVCWVVIGNLTRSIAALFCLNRLIGLFWITMHWTIDGKARGAIYAKISW